MAPLKAEFPQLIVLDNVSGMKGILDDFVVVFKNLL